MLSEWSPAGTIMMCWASLLNVAGLGVVELPPVETGAFKACLEAQVSVEEDFSLRNQRSDASFVGCRCF